MGVPHKVAVPTPPFWAANTLLTSQMQMTPSAAPVMPRPSSMLFDLEMEEATAGTRLDTEAQQAVIAVQRLVGRSMTACCEVVRDVDAACESVLAHGRSVCSTALAEELGQLGYAVAIRESLGGGSGGQCLRNLRHAFLCCMPGQRTSADQPWSRISGSTVIVDPTFRDQFDIVHKTPRYAAVLQALPAVLVSHLSRIQALVELLCAEMSLAFHSTGTVLPPWRYAKSMLTKWQPRQSIDLNLRPAASPTAAAKARATHPALPPMAAPAVVRSSLLFRNAQAVSEASGSSSNSTGSGTTCFLAPCKSQSGSSGNQAILTTQVHSSSSHHHQQQVDTHQRQQDPYVARHNSGECSSPIMQVSVTRELLPDGSAVEMFPARRQLSYEPLRRVVGGFAASLGSSARNSLLTA